MTKKIFFDLDGTVYDLYGQKDWLPKIRNEESGVFTQKAFLVDYSMFIDKIATLTRKGFTFGVITWLPMNASPEYEEVCRLEKIDWIDTWLPFTSEVNIQPYGVPKQNAIQKRAKKMFLIDDNSEVCKVWEKDPQRMAINLTTNFSVLDALDKIIREE